MHIHVYPCTCTNIHTYANICVHTNVKQENAQMCTYLNIGLHTHTGAHMQMCEHANCTHKHFKRLFFHYQILTHLDFIFYVTWITDPMLFFSAWNVHSTFAEHFLASVQCYLVKRRGFDMLEYHRSALWSVPLTCCLTGHLNNNNHELDKQSFRINPDSPKIFLAILTSLFFYISSHCLFVCVCILLPRMPMEIKENSQEGTLLHHANTGGSDARQQTWPQVPFLAELSHRPNTVHFLS